MYGFVFLNFICTDDFSGIDQTYCSFMKEIELTSQIKCSPVSSISTWALPKSLKSPSSLYELAALVLKSDLPRNECIYK